MEKSPPYGIPPIVVHLDTAPQFKEQLTEILLAMHQDPAGKAILEKINIERFTTVEDSLYDSVREMQRWVAEQEQD